MASRIESVPTADGSFGLQVWLPESGTGPGLLLIQEIFGISDYIRDVADYYAEEGYVVLAPDLFWRIEPGIEIRSRAAQDVVFDAIGIGQADQLSP